MFLLLIPSLVPAESPANLAAHVAGAHGHDKWSGVKKLSYTFNVTLGDKQISRSWIWEPVLDRVTLVDEGLTYTRDQREDHAEVDAKFINDQYWLLFPLHLAWDDVRFEASDGPEPLPVGEGTGRRLTVIYPDTGGYTPGDAYDLFVDDTYRVQAWVFRKGGGPEPTRSTAWTGYQTLGGLPLSLDRPGPDPASFRVFFTNVSVE